MVEHNAAMVQDHIRSIDELKLNQKRVMRDLYGANGDDGMVKILIKLQTRQDTLRDLIVMFGILSTIGMFVIAVISYVRH